MKLFVIEKRGRAAGTILAALPLFVAGLALSRLLYEALFPRFLFLGRPLPVVLFAGVLTTIALAGWQIVAVRQGDRDARQMRIYPAALSPLLLNLLYLLDPVVNLPGSRFLFAASLWLTAFFLARLLADPERWHWLSIVFVWLALFPLYLWTMPAVVGRADTFEFQVVIPQLGIAHPTGYPLYILLGRLFATLPLGSVAWRINLASAVFASMAATFVYLAGRRAWKVVPAALFAAVALGLTPTLWSQAVEAEVYALHALIVAAALWLMVAMLEPRAGQTTCAGTPWHWPSAASWHLAVWLLAFVIGLGLANHLTTVILIPAALLAAGLTYSRCLRAADWRSNLRLLIKVALAFTLPLLFYAYLPLRWTAIHNEPMGMARFVDWVVGGRFQGALQLSAWLTDVTRYAIVWRLLTSEWGWFNLLLAFLGTLYALARNWRVALVLLVTMTGYLYYALNYHVPDLAVFLIPAHIVIALFWGAGMAACLSGTAQFLDRRKWQAWQYPAGTLLALILILPQLYQAAGNLPDTRFPERTALQAWGQGVLSLPLEYDAVILADSEKIAPLAYLQQAEGLRPDLDIMVLPDENAYRAELDRRLAAGETAYLARFLPGLEGIYHLRSLGPLIEVSDEPLLELPPDATAADLDFGMLRLAGYAIEEPAAGDANATAVTLFWQLAQPAPQPEFIYVRWSKDTKEGQPDVAGGAHPARDYYPTLAFRPGEIVSDYHLLPRPGSGVSQRLDLQIATGPQFALPDSLQWQTVTTVDVQPALSLVSGHAFRAQNGRMLLSGAGFPAEIRPETPLPIVVSGYATRADLLAFELVADGELLDPPPPAGTLAIDRSAAQPIVYETDADTSLADGLYHLYSSDPTSASHCGWLAAPSAGCVLGEVLISGVPLADDAVNFDDKVALLSIDIPGESLRPGGELAVHLRWQSLAPMVEDYTVFLQVLDEQDRIVGQVDAWPQQGTFPTSQWDPGEVVDDDYNIQLSADLPPGEYRLQAGLYLLANLQRLPVLDSQGVPVDDKVVLHGLSVE